MILEALTTITMVLGGGGGYAPTPYQEAMSIQHTLTPPYKAAVGVWNPPDPEPHTHQSSPAESDTEPASGVWYRLAACETGRGGEPTWDYDESRYNWGSGIFDGGLQFLPSTWTAHKPESYPSHAYLATPAQQIEVGRRVAAAQGAGAWPSCTAELGISTEDLLNG